VVPAPVHRVSELLPPGYESYFRVFHPFVPWKADPAQPVEKALRHSWAELAAEAGIEFHNQLSWCSLEPVLCPWPRPR